MFDWVTFQGFTCVEWGVIISSFGKFRRFAERFFIKNTALTSLVISDDIFSEFYCSEPFKKHFAMVSSALHKLRQHIAYPTNQISPQQKPPTNSNFIGSRLKAVSMMDAAIEV
ncbi:hypothetical protein V6N12_025668 [Hibiscus sabdariffa]|uniref:Uncharacterized protein n=1 Tax=Hibiscus sabdariffa TaxID=183260 RepID=A0ABR2AXN1_9ROSI